METVVREKFKVKIGSLADESRLIRSRIDRLGRRMSKVMRSKKKNLESGPEASDPARDRLFEESRVELDRAINSLRDHRKVVVRRESRHTFLAYAFLRGMPFRKVECREPVIAEGVGGWFAPGSISIKEVVRIIKSLGSRSWFREVTEEQVRAWIAGAVVPSVV